MSLRFRNVAVFLALLGLCVGTVPAQGQSVSFTAEEVETVPDDTTTVDVIVSDFVDVTSAQFTLEWDAAVVAFDSTGGYNLPGLTASNFGTNRTDEGTLTFSWNDPDAEGVTVSDSTAIFRLHLRTTGGFDDTTAVSFTDDPTAREVTVNFNVATFDDTPGAVRLTAAPDAPTGLVKESVDRDSVSLAWNANTESDLDGYTVYRDTVSFADPDSAMKLNASPVNVTAYTDSTVAQKTTYYYRVTAVDTVGNEGPASTEIDATPGDNAPPANLSVDRPSDPVVRRSSAPNDTLTVAYSYEDATPDTTVIAVRDGSGNAARFGVDDSGYGGNGGEKSVILDLSAPDALQGSGLVDGSTYDLEITATDAASNDTSVTEANLVTIDESAPDPPVSLSTSATADSVELTWTAGDSSDVRAYRVYRDTAPIDSSAGPGSYAALDTVAATQTAYTDASVASDQTYYYRATAVDTARNESGFSNEASASPGSPDPPSSLSVASVDSESIALDWDPSDSTDVEAYRVYRDTAPIDSSARPVGSLAIDTVAATQTAYTDTTVVEGQTYYYRATAVDTVGNESGYSNEASETPGDGTPPDVPTALSASEVKPDSVALTWTASGSTDVETYRVYRDTAPIDSSAGPVESLALDTVAATQTAYTDTTVAEGQTYYYRATAVDTVGNESGYSNEVSETPGDGAPPDPPKNLSLTGEEPDSLSFDWDSSDSADVETYRVYRDTAPIDSSVGPGSYAVYDSVTAENTSYTDTAVTTGTSYYYRVTAADSVRNESAFSPEAVATPRDRLYVNASNTPSGCGTASSVTGLDGSSWDCAFPYLQDAFDLANRNAGTSYEIWIAAGTYYPDADTVGNDGVDDGSGSDHTADERREAFTLTRDSVAILGGFSGGETTRSDRDPETNQVILSGDIDQNDGAFAPDTDSDGVDSTFTQTDHHNGTNAYHVLLLDGTVTGMISAETVLDGVTVRAGRADSTANPHDIGAGLYCRGGGSGNACSPTIRSVRFEGNYAAGAGGAVFNKAAESGTSSPTLTDVTFDGNAATSAGGALFNEAGGTGTSSPTLSNPTFTNNATGSLGGAIYNDGGDGADGATSSPTITGGTFDENTAGYRGGAVYNDAHGGTANPTITNVVFTQNSAPVDSVSFTFPAGGGAIVNGAFAGGTVRPEIADARFENNRAVASQSFGVGGAIYTFSDSTDQNGMESVARMSVTNTTFSSNVTSGGGGAIHTVAIRSGAMDSEIQGSTFSGNEATRGGALRLESLESGGTSGRSTDSTTVQNATFTDNRASDRGGAVFIEGRNSGESLQTLTDVVFSGNEAAAGGAVEVFGNETSPGGTPGRAAPTLRDAEFRQNQTTGAGGALVNRTRNGGAATPTIANALFAGNAAEIDGGGVSNRSPGEGAADPTFVNVTFAGNTADESGGALASRQNSSGSASPVLVNAIFWNDGADADGDGSGSADEIFVADGSPTLRYSIVDGGCPPAANCGDNLLSRAPQFAGRNVGAGPDNVYGTGDDDLRLQGEESGGGASPAIDAGDNAALDLDGDGTRDIEEDLQGRPRPLDVADVRDTGDGTAPVVDMGTLESDGAPLRKTPFPLTAIASPDSVSLQWKAPTIVGVDQYRIYRNTAPIDSASGPSGVNEEATIPAGETTYVDDTVQSDTTYYYRVTAVDTASRETGFSNEAAGVTETPLAASSNTVQSDGTVNFGETGVDLTFTGVASSGDVAVSKFASAPVGTDGISESNVSAFRYTMEARGTLAFDSTDVEVDLSSVGDVSEPGSVTMYRRPEPGNGTFEALSTEYDSENEKIVATTASLSEFALASDAEDLPGSSFRVPSLVARGSPGKVTLSWSAPSASTVAGYNVYRSPNSFSDTTNASRINGSELVDGTRFVDDSNVESGASYYYRISAVGADGFVGPPSNAVDVALPPSGFSANWSRTFGDPTERDNYRLVAQPGREQIALDDAVSGTAGEREDYRAFRELGGTNADESSIQECSSCEFGPGKGFWLLARDAWSPSSSEFLSVALTDQGTYEVDLNPGWNIISNPFAVNVDWQDVIGANDGTLDPSSALYTRENATGFGTETTLASAQTGRAYYVKNQSGGTSSLVLPHPEAIDSVSASSSSASKAVAKHRQIKQVRDSARAVSLQASVNGQPRGAVRVGVTEEAHVGIDLLDVESPPFPVPTVALRALADSGGTTEALLHDYRPLENGGQRFPLQLETNGREMITLRPGTITVEERHDVLLVKKANGRTYDLREEEKIVLQPEADTVPFVLLVGTPTYVDEQKARLAPNEVKLLGNYPNPVSRSTTIEYGLPEEDHVRLELYDVLGRRVQVLVEETQRAGFHRVQWREGSDRSLASGVYFYRLRVGDKSKVKKMTVVR